MKLRNLALAACAFALAVPADAQVQRREIGAQVFEDVPETPPEVKTGLARYQNARSAFFADWMPDGSMLIRTRFGATYQLHRVAAPGASREQLTFYDDPVANASVVPGSGKFIFMRDAGGDEWVQLFLSDGRSEAVALTEPGTRNLGLALSSDGSRAVWAVSRRGDPDSDIVVADLTKPGERRVAYEGQGALSPLDISPDGKTALLGRYLSITESKRYLLDLATGALKEIAPNAGKVAYDGGEFTPDGRSIILLSDKGSDVMRLVEMNLATGAETVLTPENTSGQKWDVEAFDLSSDGRVLAWSVNEEGYSRIYTRDFRTRRALPQPDLPQGVLAGLKLSSDGSKLAIAMSTPTSAGDVWSWGTADGVLTRWTMSELGGLDAAKLVSPELVRFRSFDGLSVPAFVYKPKGAQGRLPVVIDIHGGPESQSRPGFNPIHQHMVAELGVAVIVPNVRGSTGYGKTYVQLDNAEKREDSVKDIGALLDWVKTQPDLDADKVVVYGQSYGGYMVLAAMTHYSDRLLAGIERYGISNWISFLTNTEAYRRDLRRAEYGDERDPKMREVFERISPLNNVAKMKRPMLIMQGSNDPRVPQSESDQMVRELRAQGVPVGYIVFKDEGHGFAKKPNNDARREAETVFLRDVFGLN